MANEKVKQFYEDHKDDIELVKKHGELTARAMARAIEKVAKEEG